MLQSSGQSSPQSSSASFSSRRASSVASVALVTGAGRGIGRAVALRFAAESTAAARWGVGVLARSVAEVRATCADVERAGGVALPLIADVSEEAAAERAVAELAAAFGAIDVLVNNAGLFRVAPLATTETATWRALLGTNLDGPFFITRAVVRRMLAHGDDSRADPREGRRGRSIVNVSSDAGKKGFPGSTGYCVTKYGLCGFGDALRLELRPHGVRVINVLPGQVDTRAWDGCGLDLEKLGIRRERMLRPEKVAEAIVCAALGEGASADEILLNAP